MIQLFQGDCLDIMPTLLRGSVDMVLCDLPYGTTQNKWDSPLPLDALWLEYSRVTKGGLIVLTANQPFTSRLVITSPFSFRYTLVWDKVAVTGFLNSKRQPLRSHEDICVFYNRQPPYNPQFTEGKPYVRVGRHKASESYGAQAINSTVSDGRRYPVSILTVSNAKRGKLHPTQKPVALMEYLIKTYTNPGDTVLDNCMGSGTTGVACVNTGRNFIGIEKDAAYFNIAQHRITAAQKDTPNENV